MDLNNEQKKAVETVNGPILILAGAGSGKTRTLTYRIAYLIQNKHTRPENILAVTFTNKAAKEMTSRVMELLSIPQGQERYYLPWIGTFHSICVRILRAEADNLGIGRSFSIYDTTDQKDIVRKVLKELDLSEKKVNPGAVLSMISSAKCELMSPDDYKKNVRGYFEELVAEIYPKYQKRLEDNNAMDFDDLIMRTVELLKSNEKVLEKYQNIFEYILVDEYQDTNHAQYMLTKLLAEKHRNICVVGDDAQSIYSFRGANITNILNFEKDYPEAEVIKLEQNYRSTKKILEASNEIISHNTEQKEKNLWTENKEGEALFVYTAMDEKDESKWIARKVRELILENVDPSEIAVLYRTNAMSRNLEEALLDSNINYRIVGGVRFYHRAEIKDVLAYLRILLNPNDLVALTRIINKPKRGIGAKTIEKMINLANTKGLGLLEFLLDSYKNDSKEIPNNVEEFTRGVFKLVELSEKEPISELIDDVIEYTGYRKDLEQNDDAESKLENIKELKSLAQKFDEMEPKEGLNKFLEEAALIESSYETGKDEDSHITLMTVHSAKGLEFDYVFIAGMEENLFPHSNSKFDSNELAEERRLAYVAITRAKQQVYMTHAESRIYFGSRISNNISRFIEDIPEHLLTFSTEGGSFSVNSYDGWEDVENDEVYESASSDLSTGDLVKHELFGVGEVEEVYGGFAVIRFQVGRKELALEYVKLQKL